MRLQGIQETDEDADSVHQLVNDDALTPGGSFPPGTVFLHGEEQIEDESPVSTVWCLNIPLDNSFVPPGEFF
jgi:hypothetical protein